METHDGTGAIIIVDFLINNGYMVRACVCDLYLGGGFGALVRMLYVMVLRGYGTAPFSSPWL